MFCVQVYGPGLEQWFSIKGDYPQMACSSVWREFGDGSRGGGAQGQFLTHCLGILPSSAGRLCGTRD